MTEERLWQITHPGPLEAELLREVRRLQSEREALKLQHSALHGFCEAALADRDALKLRVVELHEEARYWRRLAEERGDLEEVPF